MIRTENSLRNGAETRLTRRDLLRRAASYLAGATILSGPVLAACGGSSSKSHEKKGSNPEIDMLNNGKWNIPGVVPESGGLRVASIDYAIRSESGARYIENHPVNLFGTHLEVEGDFEITADLHDVAGEAAITLYGTPPIIFDELRYETPSVRIALEGNSLWVGVMDVEKQDYGEVRNFQVEPSKDAQVKISRVGGQLIISLNGQKVGQVPASGTFSSGEVWLGLDSSRDKDGWLLAGMNAQGVNGGKVETVDASRLDVPKDPNGLNTLAQNRRPGFLIGTAIAPAPLVSDSKYAELALNGNFGTFTPENAMKFQFLQPSPGIYSFEEADALVAVAKQHGIKIHGHTLDFAGAIPKWVHDIAKNHPERLESVLVKHIRKVVGHFGNDVMDWDVVNEPLADYDTEPGKYGLRKNIWYEAMGPDHVIIALKAAHEANPNATLWINEFGMESDSDRFNDMLALVKRAIAAGITADKLGVGFQAHIDESDTINGRSIDKSKLRQHIRALGDIGVKARISELDISSEEQMAVFAEVLEVAIKEPNCTDVTVWGITDKYGAGNTTSGGHINTNVGRLWDASEQPTPALAAVRKVLAG